MLERNFEPGGRVVSYAKDADTIMAIATDLGVALPGFTPVAAAFDRLLAAVAGELDHSALILLLEGNGELMAVPDPGTDHGEGSPAQP